MSSFQRTCFAKLMQGFILIIYLAFLKQTELSYLFVRAQDRIKPCRFGRTSYVLIKLLNYNTITLFSGNRHISFDINTTPFSYINSFLQVSSIGQKKLRWKRLAQIVLKLIEGFAREMRRVYLS